MFERYRAHLPSFLRYMAIGGFVFCIDFGSYAMFLQRLHLNYLLAGALSQTIAFLTHFTLNKYLNFRSFDRSTREQFGTYIVVALFCLVVGLAVMKAWVWLFGVSTLNMYLARCAAVGVNIPIGFIGHKKLTFGAGLRALVGQPQRAA